MPLLIASAAIGLALAGAALLALCQIAGQDLPKQPGTGRCWYCGEPTDSATGVCERCREVE